MRSFELGFEEMKREGVQQTRRQQLQELLATSKARVVAVVGAGVSVGATGAKEAEWPGLLRSGLERCVQVVDDLPKAWSEHREADIDGGRLGDMIGVADAITRELGGGRDPRFGKWLEDTLGDLKIKDRRVLEALAALGVPLATTNYDDLLHVVAERPVVTWQEKAKALAVINGQRPGVLHLHGNFREPESVVFGSQSYDELLRDEAAQSVQRTLALAGHLLFVGCGGTLADPNFGRLLAWLRENFPKMLLRHYRLCKNDEVEALEREHAADKVTVLSYGSHHAELPRFLRSLTPRKQRGAKPSPAPAPLREPQDDALDAYRSWALERYGRVSLIGLGPDELRLDLSEIYVPLRLGQRGHGEGVGALGAGGGFHAPSEGKRSRRSVDGDVGLSEIFAGTHADHPHALVLGEPGAGKTTALRKLLHELLTRGPQSLNLPTGTVPLYLRLRRLSWKDVKRSDGQETLALEDFAERELAELSEGAVPIDLGRRLLRRGNVLLLLDGLDEVAEDALRAEVCKYLEWQLLGAERRGVRAVVSCRPAGYGGAVQLGERFGSFEVKALDAQQVNQLVRLWFRDVGEVWPRLTPKEAREKAEDLVAKLASEDYASHQIVRLVSTPLLLTLLCVVVARGGDIPRQRVAFYEECLRVLLSLWGKAQGRSKPPLELEAALTVLRPLAYRLHQEERRDDLAWVELVRHLQRLGINDPLKVGRWLHREAGVLAQVAPHQYGFAHLGLQEYLTAVHVAMEGVGAVRELACRAGEKWWKEVILLLVALPGRNVFAPFVEALLAGKGDFDHEELLSDCLNEAATVELVPFIEVLEGDAAASRKAALLRLLLGRREPRLLEAASALQDHENEDLRALARRVVEEAARSAPRNSSEACEILVLHDSASSQTARDLLRILEAKGLRGRGVETGGAWQEQLEPLLSETSCALVLSPREGDPPWANREELALLGLLGDRECRFVVAELGDGEAASRPWPEALPSAIRVHRAGERWDGVLEVLSKEGEGQIGGLVKTREFEAVKGLVEGQPFTDDLTGIRLLWIPEGRFQMGAHLPKQDYPTTEKDFFTWHLPIHQVMVSGFWLAETPVTNQQYGLFLKERGLAEPEYWRDRRFSWPAQPVVGVSWEEARKFCEWLSSKTGLSFRLPSEAMWEYAARGEEGREYPWGSALPDASRACHGLDWETDQPAAVGSFPAGAGPFGTLDQAGLVWEWCRDAWVGEAYRRAPHTLGLDPAVDRGGEAERRVVRGGGWSSPPEVLRSAVRLKFRAKIRRDNLSFRVCVS